MIIYKLLKPYPVQFGDKILEFPTGIIFTKSPSGSIFFKASPSGSIFFKAKHQFAFPSETRYLNFGQDFMRSNPKYFQELPLFEVGDWVTNTVGHNTVHRITAVTDDYYMVGAAKL